MAHIAGFTMGAVAARLFENPERLASE